MFHLEFIILSLVATSNFLDLSDSSHFLQEFLVLGLHFFLQCIPLFIYFTHIVTHILYLALQRHCESIRPIKEKLQQQIVKWQKNYW